MLAIGGIVLALMARMAEWQDLLDAGRIPEIDRTLTESAQGSTFERLATASFGHWLA